MRAKGLLAAVAAAVCIGVGAVSSFAAWPSHTFAPYVYLGAGDGIKVTTIQSATGQKYFTLAFVIADGSGNPTWDSGSVSSGYYSSQINSLRSNGGDIIISFGGAGGKELALTSSSVSTVQAKYEAVISKYKCTWLDFDIEGGTLTNRTANHRRNTAIKNLQSKHSGLQVSFTLPADASGMDSNAIDLLKNAVSQGVKIRTVNLMTMDFGNAGGKSESSVSEATASAGHKQVSAISSSIHIGMTPMIGQNDVKAEVFSLNDAKAVVSYAKANSWIDHLAFWSSNRDKGTSRNTSANDTSSGIVQKPYDFTNIFKSY